MGIHLGINDTKIKEIGSRNTTWFEKIFDLLRFWTNSYTGDLDTMEQELIRAFREIERNEIAEMLHNACFEKRSLRKSDF